MFWESMNQSAAASSRRLRSHAQCRGKKETLLEGFLTSKPLRSKLFGPATTVDVVPILPSNSSSNLVLQLTTLC